MTTALEWLLLIAAACLVVAAAYRDAKRADEQEADYERFRQRANRHQRPSDP